MARYKPVSETWEVDIKGTCGSRSWEISVLRSDNHHGKKSYGWMNENKLLVGHDGGPCNDIATRFVWDRLVQIAKELAEHLNSGGHPN